LSPSKCWKLRVLCIAKSTIWTLLADFAALFANSSLVENVDCCWSAMTVIFTADTRRADSRNYHVEPSWRRIIYGRLFYSILPVVRSKNSFVSTRVLHCTIECWDWTSNECTVVLIYQSGSFSTSIASRQDNVDTRIALSYVFRVICEWSSSASLSASASRRIQNPS